MSSRWRALLANIHVWQRKGERAPHKALLTLQLLARAQRGEPRKVRYAEVDERLRLALATFGPPRRSQHPELPFWYLRSDGFWTIPSADDLPSRAGKRQPTRSVLLARDVTGEVPAALWAELCDSREQIPELALIVLRRFWPESWHQEIASFFGLELTDPANADPTPASPSSARPSSRRRAAVPPSARDPLFRDDVLRAYERRCAVCGYDARLADAIFGLDAAHIQWHANGGPDVVRNGLALCSLHHVAFDRGAIGLDGASRVVVSQDVVGSSSVEKLLLDYHGAPLRRPQDSRSTPAPEYVAWHREWVFREPARV